LGDVSLPRLQLGCALLEIGGELIGLRPKPRQLLLVGPRSSGSTDSVGLGLARSRKLLLPAAERELPLLQPDGRLRLVIGNLLEPDSLLLEFLPAGRERLFAFSEFGALLVHQALPEDELLSTLLELRLALLHLRLGLAERPALPLQLRSQRGKRLLSLGHSRLPRVGGLLLELGLLLTQLRLGLGERSLALVERHALLVHLRPRRGEGLLSPFERRSAPFELRFALL